MTLTFELQYRYEFSCSIAQHYQLTDSEIKNEIAEHYVPKGFCSVSDFEWKETKL